MQGELVFIARTKVLFHGCKIATHFRRFKLSALFFNELEQYGNDLSGTETLALIDMVLIDEYVRAIRRKHRHTLAYV